jgi:hypothetical protein
MRHCGSRQSSTHPDQTTSSRSRSACSAWARATPVAREGARFGLPAKDAVACPTASLAPTRAGAAPTGGGEKDMDLAAGIVDRYVGQSQDIQRLERQVCARGGLWASRRRPPRTAQAPGRIVVAPSTWAQPNRLPAPGTQAQRTRRLAPTPCPATAGAPGDTQNTAHSAPRAARAPHRRVPGP